MKKILALLLAPVLVHAHQTVSTHPIVSTKAVNLIKEKDGVEKAYAQLYSFNLMVPGEADLTRRVNHPLFWGLHSAFNHEQSQADEETIPSFPFFRNNVRTVIDGVVMQDAPVTRVLTHFYNAYSGEGLFGGTTSKSVAVQKFLNAVELMGYSNHIRQGDSFNALRWYGSHWADGENPPAPDQNASHDQYLAFWYFGHSLHHLEDMGSIAHTQTDAHLTLGSERSLN